MNTQNLECAYTSRLLLCQSNFFETNEWRENFCCQVKEKHSKGQGYMHDQIKIKKIYTTERLHKSNQSSYQSSIYSVSE